MWVDVCGCESPFKCEHNTGSTANIKKRRGAVKEEESGENDEAELGEVL